MLHSLIIQVKVSSVNKAELGNVFDTYNYHLLFGLLNDHLRNLKNGCSY